MRPTPPRGTPPSSPSYARRPGRRGAPGRKKTPPTSTRDRRVFVRRGVRRRGARPVPRTAGGSLPAPGDAFTMPLTGDITYEAGFNANGIAYARGSLVIVQSNTGLVFTVDSDGVATQVELTGDAGAYLVTNGDGIEVHGNTLAVVRNFDNLVATFRLNGPMTAGVLTAEIGSDSFAIPTTATWAAGDLWVVNARFDVQNPPPDLPYWISRVPGL